MKALIIHPFGLGDVIFSLPLLEALRTRLGAEVHYWANERTPELLALAGVKRVHVWNRDTMRAQYGRNPFAWLGGWWGTISALRKEKYDVCFDWSLGREYAALAFLAGIPARVGMDYRGRGKFLTHKLAFESFELKSARECGMELLRKWRPKEAQAAVLATGYPAVQWPADSERKFRQWLDSHGVANDERWVCMSPGGGASWGKDAHYKQWAPLKFAELAERLAEEDDFRLILLGSPSDEALCREVAAHARTARPIIVTGESLEMAARILQRSDLWIGNDGGLLHLADWIGTPLVGIYGPVSEKAYGPRPGRARTAVATAAVACRPCYGSFRFPPCAHQKICLEHLSVDYVRAEALKLLHG